MKKVTYIISNIDKALAFEWIAELMDKQNIELSFVLLNDGDTALEEYLIHNGFVVKRINYKNKFDIPKALIYTVLFFVKQKPNVIHTHLFDANIVGLLSGWLCRIKKRIYTRHHSTFHHQYFPKAVKYDKLCNFLATDIIAVTEGVKQILIRQENVSQQKIKVIHHGFKLGLFEKKSSLNAVQQLKNKYGTEYNYPVIGVISRYTEWKGIQYIIPAFKQLLLIYPNAKLVLANADGDYKSQIKCMLRELSHENYIEIPFEKDVFNLYHLFDIFVHTPVDNHCEAFGQVYIEALAAGIPSIFTLSGIANDFIIHAHNAMVVHYKTSDEILNAIKETINDNELKNRIIKNGLNDVNEIFCIDKSIKYLEEIYTLE